ncbi:Pleiotropic drug resistance protein 3 [Glycine soja]
MLEEFIPQKSSAYVSQYDLHIPEMTVRETLDFSARCQGVGSHSELLMEISRKEKEAGIVPDPDLDAYMATSIKALKSSLQTDYILKVVYSFYYWLILGLDICANTSVGRSYKKRYIWWSKEKPAPETFDLFDDVVLMAEGKIVYHGPHDYILEFFEDCGFKCPQRKGTADFLQEVTSTKDQAQYWNSSEKPYSYVSIDQFIEKFKDFPFGLKLKEELSKPFDESQPQECPCLHDEGNSSNEKKLFCLCIQLVIVAFVAMTVFIRTQMAVDVLHGNYFMGSSFYSLIILLVDGFPELSMTVSRLAVIYKQKELCFFPAWAYTIPSAVLKIPLSLLESFIWTTLSYYVIGYSPEIGRFFRQFLLSFIIHMTSVSMFRFIASICQTVWGFWVSPLTYGEIGLTVNEFLAPRWEKFWQLSSIIKLLIFITSRKCDSSNPFDLFALIEDVWKQNIGPAST